MFYEIGGRHKINSYDLLFNKYQMKTKFKQDHGVAGLTILLSLIVMLFVIGLLVMIFSIMGGKLQTATYDVTSKTLTNEAVVPSQAGTLLTGSDAYFNYRDCVVVSARNGSASGTLLGAGNYTVLSGCLLKNLTNTFPTYSWYVNYTLNYDELNTATTTMNDTTNAVSTVTDWFDIFIVIGAMVVLILLTVIIITSIRGSGLIADGGRSGRNTVGSA